MVDVGSPLNRALFGSPGTVPALADDVSLGQASGEIADGTVVRFAVQLDERWSLTVDGAEVDLRPSDGWASWAEVVDGDGLTIGPVRIRLHGIDAPELGQRCAERGGGTWQCDEAAAARLDDLIGGSAVSCEPLDRDAYGRIIARCTANGADLAAVLASEGRVWAFHRYSEDYAEAEEAARADGLGIWQASTEPAWDYRADRWERAAEQAPDGCPIKGNVSSKDELIYHTPWSP